MNKYENIVNKSTIFNLYCKAHNDMIWFGFCMALKTPYQFE